MESPKIYIITPNDSNSKQAAVIIWAESEQAARFGEMPPQLAAEITHVEPIPLLELGPAEAPDNFHIKKVDENKFQIMESQPNKILICLFETKKRYLLCKDVGIVL